MLLMIDTQWKLKYPSFHAFLVSSGCSSKTLINSEYSSSANSLLFAYFLQACLNSPVLKICSTISLTSNFFIVCQI